MIHTLHTIVEWLAVTIDVVASVIMVWAFLVAVYSFVMGSFGRAPTERIRGLQIVRCDLGMNLVFALELMIISDVLHTILSRTMDDLLFLGALVLIRTIIAFFLNHEIQGIETEIVK